MMHGELLQDVRDLIKLLLHLVQAPFPPTPNFYPPCTHRWSPQFLPMATKVPWRCQIWSWEEKTGIDHPTLDDILQHWQIIHILMIRVKSSIFGSGTYLAGRSLPCNTTTQWQTYYSTLISGCHENIIDGRVTEIGNSINTLSINTLFVFVLCMVNHPG